MSNIQSRLAAYVFVQNEELKRELEKAQGTNTTGNLEAEMLGTRKRTATERHREQLRKLEKEKKEAQEVSWSTFI